jgi:Flp pilus assembly protein TadG
MRRDAGSALVEFALVLPVLLILVLGILTGGLSLSRGLSLSSAAREATRFGATYPTTGGLNAWLDGVANRAVTEANGDLDSGIASRYLCVAYVSPGTTTNDTTYMREQSGSGAPVYTANATCFADGRPSDERRVQVLLRRTTVVDTFVTQRTVTVQSQSVGRFEVSAI